MSNQAKLFSYGHKPVVLEVSKQKFKDLTSGKKPFFREKWERLPGPIDYQQNENGLEAIFHYDIKENVQSTDYILFAYTYPYNYNDCEWAINEFESKMKAAEKMHFEREVLCKTLEGRDMHLLTFCSNSALELEKPVVFFTGRVHCGESPGSYML